MLVSRHLILSFNCARKEVQCFSSCYYQLVESVPQNLTFAQGSPSHMSTTEAWLSLLNGAESRVDMAVFYWSLTSEDVKPGSMFPSAVPGQDLLGRMMSVGLKDNITMRIAQNAPTPNSPQNNSEELRKAGAAEVLNVDMQHLVGGVLHTKMWIIDDDKFYLGSANMDFRSLTQVKELGVVLWNCSCLARDMRKIFEQYRYVGARRSIPAVWPANFSTDINRHSPLTISLNGSAATAFISSSPPAFTSLGRENDVDAIVAAIDDARRFVDVAVMDYLPRTLYSRHVQFWPVIDNALRKAALERRVRVRVLASLWQHSRDDLAHWLLSLSAITSSYPQIDVQVKLFVVPAYTPEQREIPFARVNHNKYMVTDRVAYIGTSNWSADYFTNTAGVGLTVNDTVSTSAGDTLRTQLHAVFNRDWNSEYAKPVQDILPTEPNKELVSD
ncbi:5'-3' exonuclease PLD3-like isoform X2 [Hyalella azteca]|uniref:5'-3' exonuclease PLD3-like isoform X2 n=1 Tax=Hyalella azteca TaxID=294128 RepID=A0A979FIT1_HYAAZ|nr:5'-3' exonuclease PLD3-like isoform X2 [Hyalella azteca]